VAIPDLPPSFGPFVSCNKLKEEKDPSYETSKEGGFDSRPRGVNEPSLGEPGLPRLGSFIFGPSLSSSSTRAWVRCSSSAQ
jgi:hypothetical protein